jgi:very-short-patch-repair endonuclease
MPVGVYERTKEARQINSEAQKKQWGGMTIEEKKERCKLWVEAGIRASQKGNQKLHHTLETKRQMSQSAEKRFAGMTKEGRLNHMLPAIKASQNASPSSIEKLIWDELDELKIEYGIQIPFANGRFVVDIYIPAWKLVIECNGDYWHNYEIFPEKKVRDSVLEKYLDGGNCKIIWLWESGIRKNPKQVLMDGLKKAGLENFLGRGVK